MGENIVYCGGTYVHIQHKPFPQTLLIINFPINHTNPLRNVTQGRIESIHIVGNIRNFIL